MIKRDLDELQPLWRRGGGRGLEKSSSKPVTSEKKSCGEQNFEEIFMTNGPAMHILWLTKMGASPLDSKTRQDLHDQDEIKAYIR
jgi:hypothetical protein